jgi:pimeloyl-ACP methyl ester carboxylesterase
VTGANPQDQLRADELQRVQSPVLLVRGDNDPFGNLDVARQVARILPNASLHEIRAGHLPFLDEPRECGDVIREFLSRDRIFNGRNASLGAEG